MKKLIPVLIVVVVVAGIIFLVNRRNDEIENGVEMPQDQAESQAFMEDSAEKFDAAKTFQMSLTQSGTPTVIGSFGDFKITFDRANDVTFVEPNRLSAKVSVLIDDLTQDVELIVIGEKQYALNRAITAGRWIELNFAQGFSGDQLRSKELGISTALVNIEDLEIVGREDIDGVSVYHFKGMVDAERVRSITVGLIGTQTGLLPIDIYVRTRDQYLARLKITEPLPVNTATGELPEPTVWQIDFFAYNQAFEVNEPAAEILPTEEATPTTEGIIG